MVTLFSILKTLKEPKTSTKKSYLCPYLQTHAFVLRINYKKRLLFCEEEKHGFIFGYWAVFSRFKPQPAAS